MKAIIDGKRYNTEMATKVAEWSSPHHVTDFHWCCEALYLTKHGNWFIHGEGAALSRYGQASVGGVGSGEAIRPVTAEVARSWLELHGFTQEIEKHFSDKIEDA